MNFYPFFAIFLNDSGEVQPRTTPYETAHVSHFLTTYIKESIKTVPLQERRDPTGSR